MLYHATHITRYKYQQPVAQCLSEVRLTPRSLPWQQRHEMHIRVVPEPAVFEERRDYFGNEVGTFSVLRTHDRLSVAASSVVEVHARDQANLPDIRWEDAQAYFASHEDADALQAFEFTFESPFVPQSEELSSYARPSFPPGRTLAEAVQELSHRVHKDFTYKPKSTSIETPLRDVLSRRRGVCQDFAHVLIGALRSQRLAARYVSGYLRPGDKVTGAQASHAWASAYLPGYGWLDLDPTNNIIPTDGHITLGWGRDYGDVPPVKGISLGGGGHKIDVEVKVRAISALEANERAKTQPAG